MIWEREMKIYILFIDEYILGIFKDEATVSTPTVQGDFNEILC